VTPDVRQAIAIFAQENVHRLQEWLDRIAEKDPAKAAGLFVRLLDYHVPKLTRAEIAVQPKTPHPFEGLSIAELEATGKDMVDDAQYCVMLGTQVAPGSAETLEYATPDEVYFSGLAKATSVAA
jgi:hypothetical protein